MHREFERYFKIKYFLIYMIVVLVWFIKQYFIYCSLLLTDITLFFKGNKVYLCCYHGTSIVDGLFTCIDV